ncbi:MAG TPA: TetR family transcriptional regulator [Naasia sp.]|jgi:AcrR family transcriptional regulator
MATVETITRAAEHALVEGEVVSLDSVARRVGLTKAGVVHHFPTKRALMIAVVDRVVDRWLGEFRTRAGDTGDAGERVRVYLEDAFTGPIDASDLALLADVKLRDALCERWVSRLDDEWFRLGEVTDPGERARLQAVRLLADGAWFDRGLGLIRVSGDEWERIADVARELLAGSRR